MNPKSKPQRMNIIEAVKYLRDAPNFNFIRVVGWRKGIALSIDEKNRFYLNIKGVGLIHFQFDGMDFASEWVKA